MSEEIEKILNLVQGLPEMEAVNKLLQNGYVMFSVQDVPYKKPGYTWTKIDRTGTVVSVTVVAVVNGVAVAKIK